MVLAAGWGSAVGCTQGRAPVLDFSSLIRVHGAFEYISRGRGGTCVCACVFVCVFKYIYIYGVAFDRF